MPTEEKSPWFHTYRGRAFPTAALPADLATYVRFEAARFGVDEALVAVAALARLGGTLAENRGVHGPSGHAVPLLLRVIMATPGRGFAAIRESGYASEAIQSERLQAAAGLDRKRIRQLRETPLFRLPGYASVPGGDPRQVAEAREHAVKILQQPLFVLTSPGARELRNGFAASFDRAVFATFDKNLLEPLLAPGRGREGRRLGDLLNRLCRGSQIDVPALKIGPKMIQPRFGFLATTTSDTLACAVTTDHEDVRTLICHSVLLEISEAATPARMAPGGIAQAGTFWKNLVGMLHEARLGHGARQGAHSSLYEPLAGWQQHLQSLSAATPEHLAPHLAPFDDLPTQLASLLLAVDTYGVWRDAAAAKAALEVSEWLLAQTLLVAEKAHGERERAAATGAEEKMLAKIVEFGPIDFWRLRRRYDRQDKAIHEPVLHALLNNKRVRLNPEGRLIAA